MQHDVHSPLPFDTEAIIIPFSSSVAFLGNEIFFHLLTQHKNFKHRAKGTRQRQQSALKI